LILLKPRHLFFETAQTYERLIPLAFIIKIIYITPDLTPTEREANHQLCLKLKEMNKDGRNYRIKNGKIVQRRN